MGFQKSGKISFRHHIVCFCNISTKIIPNTVTALFRVSEQHDSVSFLNESILEMIRFNHNKSLINSDSLTPTAGFNFTFNVKHIQCVCMCL